MTVIATWPVSGVKANSPWRSMRRAIGCLSPDQRRLYLAVPHRGAQRAEIRVFDVRD